MNGHRSFPSRITDPTLRKRNPVFSTVLSLVACVLFIPSTLPAQTMVVHQVDVSDFPTIRATFYAFDTSGLPIRGLTAADVRVVEDAKERTVTGFVSPPPSAPLPVSAVFAVGTCVMMENGGMYAARTAMRWWADSMLSTESECAITTFDDTTSHVQQLFTSDREELRRAIADLPVPTARGYDYFSALQHPPAGALDIAPSGKHRKVIVLFFSDPGGSNGGNADYCGTPVIAQEEDVQINAVGFGSRIPVTIWRVCDRSDGYLFDQLGSTDEAIEVFRKILWSASAAAPFEVEWVSDGCAQLDRNVSIQLPTYEMSAEKQFEVPALLLPQLLMDPPISLRFRDVAPGTESDQQLTITALRRSVRVNAITSSNPLFSITDYGGTPPPFLLDENESRTLTVTFSPKDVAYNTCRIELETDGCFGMSWYADGGNLREEYHRDTLEVRRPNGREQLVVGTLEDLTWQVTPAETPVRLEYSTDGGIHWMLIAEDVSGGAYTWRVPLTPSDSCLLRATRQTGSDYLSDMEFLPPGTFLMGNITNHINHMFWGTWGYAYDSEKPVHEVSITRPMFMGRTEVTQALYESVMGALPSQIHERSPDRPVHTLEWQDAVQFCNQLSAREGLEPCYSGTGEQTVCDFDATGYRLPTEAEWEYACRAGTRTDYYTGNLPPCQREVITPSLDAAAWYLINTGALTSHPLAREPLPVGLKEPNAFGLYDMYGNAYEFCWDKIDQDYYRRSPNKDPRGTDGDLYSHYCRVARGGAFCSDARYCRSASRFPVIQNLYLLGAVGFRLVRKLEF